MKNIQVFARSVYGKIAIYPANEAAEIFSVLVGKKTFTPFDLSLLAKLGHEVEYVVDPKVAQLTAA